MRRFYSHIQLKPVDRTIECIQRGLDTYGDLFNAAKKRAGEGEDVQPRVWLGAPPAAGSRLPLVCGLPLRRVC